MAWFIPSLLDTTRYAKMIDVLIYGSKWIQ